MGNTNENPSVSVELFKPQKLTHRVFLGPKFLFSLYHNRDEDHETSSAFIHYIAKNSLPYRQLIVNDHAVDEAATRLKRRSSHQNAIRMLTNIEQSDLYRVEMLSRDVFEETRKKFIDWDDKDASFTDFLIATHMATLGVECIATYDPHFGAFGLNTIPYTK